MENVCETDTPHITVEHQLLKRILELEDSHAQLKQTISELIKTRNSSHRHTTSPSFPPLSTEAQCFNILQSIDVPIHMVDHKGCVCYSNPAWENLYGYNRAESQGKSAIDIIVGPADATITTKIVQLILQGETRVGEYVLRNKKGDRLCIYCSTKPFVDENGKVIGYIAITSLLNAYPETSQERKVGAPIQTASEQPLPLDLVNSKANKQELSSVLTCDFKQPWFHIKWMVKNGIPWPWKGNERKGASFDSTNARFCWHWLYHSDQEHEYVLQMTSCIPAKVESQPQVDANTLSQLFSSFEKVYEIRWEDLMIRECIGRGSYGILYHAVWYRSDVTVKLIPRQEYSHYSILSFRREVSFMKRFRHPNILLFMGAVVSPHHLCIVTAFLSRGSLFQLLHRSRGKFNMKHQVHMALDIARGMNYLHCCFPPIIHCDLKSANLFVDKNWTVKFGDFGMCCMKHETKKRVGTPAWMAPEVLRNEGANEKSDVYSYGVVLWEITTQKVPWDGLNLIQVTKVVGFGNQRLDIPKDVDPRWASIIQRCLCSKPDSRPTFQELLHDIKELQKNQLVKVHTTRDHY